MGSYRVDAGKSRINVRARSTVHDTDTVWDRLSGTIEVAPEAVDGARGTVAVDMTHFDAGDWLKNRKLKKDIDPAAHPEARFTIESVDSVTPRDDGSFDATVAGTLAWRGRTVSIRASGVGSIDGSTLRATGSFDLNVRDLGVTPPRFLMLKVEDVVSVTVTLVARA